MAVLLCAKFHRLWFVNKTTIKKEWLVWRTFDYPHPRHTLRRFYQSLDFKLKAISAQMADGKLNLKRIPEFENSDRGLTIGEWFEKAADLVFYLCGVKNITSVLPLRLSEVRLLCPDNSARKKERYRPYHGCPASCICHRSIRSIGPVRS